MIDNHLSQLSEEALENIIKTLAKYDRDCRAERKILGKLIKRNEDKCRATTAQLKLFLAERERREPGPRTPEES